LRGFSILFQTQRKKSIFFLGFAEEPGFVIRTAANENILSTKSEQIQGGLKLSSRSLFLFQENPEAGF
jgi:hypothetical protein